MRTRTFLAFIAPSFALMTAFIAVPLVLVLWQSFHITRGKFHDVVVETCAPGFLTQTCTREKRSEPARKADGTPITETEFAGFENYRLLLRPDEVRKAFAAGGGGLSEVLGLDFYRALRFTLTFTFLTLPLILILGLVLALAVDNAARSIRGPVIFVSLLPYIITPVIGALSIRWLFVGDGIMTAALQALSGRRILMFADGWTIELLMLFYRVWHVAPFAFIVFYAGLQTLDQQVVESAVIDGADRWNRLRFIVLPHLAPLMVFVTLIHLMDAYRVFEEVIGFSSQAYRISLQWLTFDLLKADHTGNRAIGRASASAMLTMIGVVILLVPLLAKTWRSSRDRAR
jgi:multiple sugar transport system permease protein